MKKSRTNPFSRRAALKAAAGCGLMSNTALMSQFINLQATKAMASQNNPTDYKAIVCVFLAGAIDSFNVLVPRNNTQYTNYLRARTGQDDRNDVPFPYPRDAGNPNNPGYDPGESLGLREGTSDSDPNDADFINTEIKEGTTGTNTGGRNFGLHPGCAYEVDPDNPQQSGTSGAPDYIRRGVTGPDKGISQLYRDGNLAFVANVGSLPYKITRPQYNSNEFQNGKPARPLGLFSHSDLQRHWQTSVPQSRAQVNGWGGRLADCFRATNGENAISMNMSINGVNVFQTGEYVVPYTVGQGATATGLNGANELNNYRQMNNYSNRIFNRTTEGILGQSYSNLVAESFKGQTRGSIEAAEGFNDATNAVSLTTPFEYGGGGASDLSRRLRKVAQIIGATHPSVDTGGQKLDQKRQVFFVQEGGWDHHNNMILSMNNKVHEVSKALTSFYRALEEMGVENDVIAFTASDFGRTLRTNGDGSDHAWGGNHILMGGPVDGGKIYGDYPTNLANPTHPDVGNLDVGQRRLIPTTAVDQYAGEIAYWFGVQNQDDMKIVLPNIGEFHNVNNGPPLGILS